MSKLTVTPTQKAEAAKIASELKVSTLHVNSKGEHFTDHNRALLSEKNNKDNVVTLDFSVAEDNSANEELKAAEKAAKTAIGIFNKAVANVSKLKGVAAKAKPEAKEAAEAAVVTTQAEADSAEADLNAANELLAVLEGED